MQEHILFFFWFFFRYLLAPGDGPNFITDLWCTGLNNQLVGSLVVSLCFSIGTFNKKFAFLKLHFSFFVLDDHSFIYNILICLLYVYLFRSVMEALHDKMSYVHVDMHTLGSRSSLAFCCRGGLVHICAAASSTNCYDIDCDTFSPHRTLSRLFSTLLSNWAFGQLCT